MSVDLARSRPAEACVALAAIATAALVAAMPLAWEAQVCALAWTCGFSWIALGRLRAPRRFEVECTGTVAVDGVAGRLRDGCFAAPWLTIVRWRPNGAWWDRTLLVAPGRLSPEDERRVRVVLRWSPYRRSPNAEYSQSRSSDRSTR